MIEEGKELEAEKVKEKNSKFVFDFHRKIKFHWFKFASHSVNWNSISLHISVPDEVCTPKKSIAKCKKCLNSDQCKVGYCCPFHKICFPNPKFDCSKAMTKSSAKCSSGCKDEKDQNKCSCDNEDFPNKWPEPTCKGNW